MKPASLYHGRLALADLAAGTIESVPLPPDILEAGVGGGSLAFVLAGHYPGAMFLCAGPLGGGYAPASGLLTISFPRAEGGGLIHAVSPLGHGAWLRQSGFDALAVTGRGTRPRVIRCGKGKCVLEDAPETDALSRSKLRAALLRRTEDGRAALILANGANPNLPVTAGSEYGSFPAGSLAGPAMRARNLLAVAFEGGSPLPSVSLPLDNPLRRACANAGGTAGTAGTDGLAAFFREAKQDAASATGFGLKSAACFHCPSPCVAWIKTGNDAHLLLADHGAYAAAVDACGENAPACLAACDEAGADPRIAGPLLHGAAVGEYASILASAAWNNDNSGLQRPEYDLTDAQQAALILGVCPRLARRAPGLTRKVFDAVPGGMAAALVRSETLLGREVFV